MNAQRTITRTVQVDRRGPGRKARHQSKAQRGEARAQVVGIVLCLAVLAGGAGAGKVWAQDTCAQGIDLGAVCEIASR